MLVLWRVHGYVVRSVPTNSFAVQFVFHVWLEAVLRVLRRPLVVLGGTVLVPRLYIHIWTNEMQKCRVCVRGPPASGSFNSRTHFHEWVTRPGGRVSLDINEIAIGCVCGGGLSAGLPGRGNGVWLCRRGG